MVLSLLVELAFVVLNALNVALGAYYAVVVIVLTPDVRLVFAMLSVQDVPYCLSRSNCSL